MKTENIKAPRMELRYNLRDELREINIEYPNDLSILIDTISKDLSELRRKKTDPNARVLLLLLRRTLGEIMSKKLDLMEYQHFIDVSNKNK